MTKIVKVYFKLFKSPVFTLFLFISFGCKENASKYLENSSNQNQSTLMESISQDAKSEQKRKEYLLLESRVKSLDYRGKNNFPFDMKSVYQVEKGETQITYTVLAIGKAAFEYALYGCIAQSKSHLKVSKQIINDASQINVRIEGTNATLVSSWFVSQIMRAMMHLENCSQNDYQEIKAKVLNWISESHLSKIKDPCTKNFVDYKSGCNGNGSTNRTFALLESELLFHLFQKNSSELTRILKDGGEYTSYLINYFYDFNSCQLNDCKTKDFDRNDSKHPSMGFQSIFKIEKIRKKMLPTANFDYHKKLKFASEEAAKLEQQFHNTSDKSSCYTGGPWESAPSILGFIGDAFSAAQNLIRINYDDCKKPYHAWGYDLISLSF